MQQISNCLMRLLCLFAPRNCEPDKGGRDNLSIQFGILIT